MFNQIHRSGLDAQVAQRGMQIAAHNLAHASNPEFAAQSIALRDGGTVRSGQLLLGTGVRIETLVDKRNAYLDSQVLQSQIDLGALAGEREGLLGLQHSLGESLDRRLDAQSISDAVGNNSSPFGISKSLDELFMSFSKAAANPALTTVKETLLSNAELLVKDFHIVASKIQKTEDNARGELAQDITKLKSKLAEIASLNQEIGRLEGNGVSTSLALDLRGKRQAVLEEVGTLIDVRVQVSDISPSALKLTTYDDNGDPVLLVDAAYALQDFEIQGNEIISNGKTLNLSGGEIFGIQKFLKNDIPSVKSSLDGIAESLVLAVNSRYNPNNDAGKNFFDATRLTAATIQLDPNLSVANLRSGLSGNDGDNSIFLALEALREVEFQVSSGDKINGSIIEAYNSIVVGVGHWIHHNKSQMDTMQSVTDRLIEDRMNRSGVSFEEEYASLTEYSYVFSASMKVMEVCKDCMDTLLRTV